MKSGILPLTEETLQQIKQKHSPRRKLIQKYLLEEVYPIKFPSIDAKKS